MKKFDIKKNSIVESIAKHILENGIKNSSLRNIAKDVSISNRMLLHYFKDKEEIVTESLIFITNNFIELLENSRSEKMVFSNLMPYLYQVLKMTEVKPYIRLCLELISLSADKEEPYYSIARKIGDTFYDWIEQIIIIEKHEVKEEKLALVLVIMEGFVVLNALDYQERIEKAMKKIIKEL
jgi:AcrR family transcriptional regulator